ncbi:glycosyltransferase family 39 protein [Dysgonomonas sp. BGC7]|uniref:glycosyltransferase family 39 protein n=1 Tax=Dysgonomonas sp. BGC7 TaxID=1658008 RepID=UPI000682E890|nr:glycosyltransferase family 39 protein [Dysgonomonas sp. BGC7]MBD8387048.1 glycosyltransferase family 39 protein [Dysgonomonas sp. BGC7]
MKSFNNIAYLLLVVLGLCLFLFLDAKDITILYDNTYSVFMSKMSYSDILHITATDVHPPLYYWGLKAYSSIFGDSLFSFRIFSTLGVLAILISGCIPIRKLFGDKVAISFILLIILFPITQYLATEIRMYSWTMFFVLSCALSAYYVFLEGKTIHWILFLLSGILSAYLHNYGLLSVLGIYFLLLIAFIYKKKNIRNIVFCALAFSVAYLPWLLQLITQMESVSEEYWIKSLAKNDLFLHIYYLYSPKEIWQPFTLFSKTQMVISLVLLMSVQLLLTLIAFASWIKSRSKDIYIAAFSFLTFIIPILIGAVLSIVYTPILVPRFMTCSLALFALSLAVVLAKVYELKTARWLFYSFWFLLSIDASVRVYSNLSYYKQTEVAYIELRDFVSKEDSVPEFVVNDFSYHVMPRLQLIVPRGEYTLLLEEDSLDIRPFCLREIKKKYLELDRFILVHQQREAVQNDFRCFLHSLSERYVVTDSLYATDIYLYKLKKLKTELDVLNY